MVYGDSLFLSGMLEEAADIYIDCLDLPGIQENDQPRVHLRSYLINIALDRAPEARAAFRKMQTGTGNTFIQMEPLVEQLEKITPEERQQPGFEKELVAWREQSIEAFRDMFRRI